MLISDAAQFEPSEISTLITAPSAIFVTRCESDAVFLMDEIVECSEAWVADSNQSIHLEYTLGRATSGFILVKRYWTSMQLRLPMRPTGAAASCAGGATPCCRSAEQDSADGRARTDTLLPATLARYTERMLQAFLPRSATRLVVYLEPISMRWGVRKLGTLCREVMGIEPDPRTCFMFVNARRDTLMVYFVDADGEQTITRKLDKGGFLLPAPEAGSAPFVIFRRSALARLFRA